MRRFLLLTTSFPPALTHEPPLCSLCRYLPAQGWTLRCCRRHPETRPRDESLGNEIPSSVRVDRVAAPGGGAVPVLLAGKAGFGDLQAALDGTPGAQGLEMIGRDSPSLIIPWFPPTTLTLRHEQCPERPGCPWRPSSRVSGGRTVWRRPWEGPGD